MTNANDELFERITAYLDNDLSDEEKAAFEAEVETNDELRELLLAATEAVQVVSRATAPKPPEDFDGGVARVIRRRSRGRFFGTWTHSHYQGSWLFALISLAFLGVWMFLATPERMDALLGPVLGPGAEPADEWDMEFPAPVALEEGSVSGDLPSPGGIPAHGSGVGSEGEQVGSTAEGSMAVEGSSTVGVNTAPVDQSRTMMQPRVQGWVYTIETSMSGDELRRELVNRVGEERLEETATGFRVRLRLHEQMQMAARLQELGLVRREPWLAASTNAPTWLEVVSTQR